MPPFHITGKVVTDIDADHTVFWGASSGRNRLCGGRLFQQLGQHNFNKNLTIVAALLLFQADADPVHATLPYYGYNRR